MRKRGPPSEHLKPALTTVLEQGSKSAEHPLDELIKLGARYVWPVASEQEVTEWLGRAHDQRGARRRRGWRNGDEPKGLKTPLGLLPVAVPQVRGTEEPFPARLAQAVGTRSNALERLATRMWVRGLSQADVEALFLETVGDRVISRTGVSEVCRQVQADFEAWQRRDLSALKVVSLVLDAIDLAVRQGTDEQEGVLCAYGILESGQQVLLSLALGSRESSDAWLRVRHDLTARGLEAPLLVVSDGQPGLRKALREVFPRASHQRGQGQKMRNILAKLPQAARALLKPLIRQVFCAATYEHGLTRGRALIARWRARYPAAMACLEQDLEAGLVYLKFPKEHHKSIRTTNLLERTFGEGRRRTKVIPRFPTETACLTLVFATLLTASQCWRGLRMSPRILRELDAIRQERYPVQSQVA
ncbi:IS256 family transposase [Nitrospira sp. Kam-Ns4a]